MIGDRYDAALLFLPRCVWHRFREPDGFFVRECLSGRGLHIARIRCQWRSITRCISSTSPRRSSWASDCRTRFAPY